MADEPEAESKELKGGAKPSPRKKRSPRTRQPTLVGFALAKADDDPAKPKRPAKGPIAPPRRALGSTAKASGARPAAPNVPAARSQGTGKPRPPRPGPTRPTPRKGAAKPGARRPGGARPPKPGPPKLGPPKGPPPKPGAAGPMGDKPTAKPTVKRPRPGAPNGEAEAAVRPRSTGANRPGPAKLPPRPPASKAKEGSRAKVLPRTLPKPPRKKDVGRDTIAATPSEGVAEPDAPSAQPDVGRDTTSAAATEERALVHGSGPDSAASRDETPSAEPAPRSGVTATPLAARVDAALAAAEDEPAAPAGIVVTSATTSASHALPPDSTETALPPDSDASALPAPESEESELSAGTEEVPFAAALMAQTIEDSTEIATDAPPAFEPPTDPRTSAPKGEETATDPLGEPPPPREAASTQTSAAAYANTEVAIVAPPDVHQQATQLGGTPFPDDPEGDPDGTEPTLDSPASLPSEATRPLVQLPEPGPEAATPAGVASPPIEDETPTRASHPNVERRPTAPPPAVRVVASGAMKAFLAASFCIGAAGMSFFAWALYVTEGRAATTSSDAPPPSDAPPEPVSAPTPPPAAAVAPAAGTEATPSEPVVADAEEGGAEPDEEEGSDADDEHAPAAGARAEVQPFDLDLPRLSRRARRMTVRQRRRQSTRLKASALRSYREQDYATAERLYREAMEYNNWDVGAVEGLARATARQSRFDEAVAWAQLAVSRASRSPIAYRVLGDVWRQAGHPDEARAAYERGIARSPNDRWLRQRLRDIEGE